MGYTRFNAALGESQALVGEWMDAQGDRALADRVAAGGQFRGHLCRGHLSGRCCRGDFLMVSAAALLAAGFGLTLLIFYPGVMTYDAKFVYEDIAKGTFGDWQSPVMVWLWGLIDPIAPGAGQHVPADCDDLLARLWHPLARARIPRQGQSRCCCRCWQ